MFILRLVYSGTEQPDVYLCRGLDDEFYLSPRPHAHGVFQNIDDFDPLVKAIRAIIELGPSIDYPSYDVWKDDRFEMQFSDEPENKILNYTSYMRDMYEVGLGLYRFKTLSPQNELVIQYIELRPSVVNTGTV